VINAGKDQFSSLGSNHRNVNQPSHGNPVDTVWYIMEDDDAFFQQLILLVDWTLNHFSNAIPLQLNGQEDLKSVVEWKAD